MGSVLSLLNKQVFYGQCFEFMGSVLSLLNKQVFYGQCFELIK